MKKHKLAVLAGAGLLSVLGLVTPAHAETAEQLTEISKKFIESLNKGDGEGQMALWSKDAELVSEDSIRYSSTGVFNYDQIRKYVVAVKHIGNAQMKVERRLILPPDVIIHEWTTSETAKYNLKFTDGQELNTKGKTVNGRGVSIYNIKDGKIVKGSTYYDSYNYLVEQAGLTIEQIEKLKQSRLKAEKENKWVRPDGGTM